MGGVYHHVSAPMEARVRANIFVQVENSVWARVQVGVQADLLKTTTGVGAYEQAPWFVWYTATSTWASAMPSVPR